MSSFFKSCCTIYVNLDFKSHQPKLLVSDPLSMPGNVDKFNE